MPKKQSGDVGRKPRLRCPNCHERIDGEITQAEFRQYGQSILPKVGDLTQCDHCRTFLEYAFDPAFMVLKVAPSWRVGLIEGVDTIADDVRLPELIESVRNRKPVRITSNFAPCMEVKTTKKQERDLNLRR